MSDIHILGAGAMGCLWAAYLSPQHDVTMIQRKADNLDYQFTFMPESRAVKVSSIQIDKMTNPIQKLILATKAYDAMPAIQPIAHLLNNDSEVILLQNGLGSQQAIHEAFSNLKLYACSSTEGAYKADQNTLIHAGIGVNTIGPLSSHAKLDTLSAWLPDNRYRWADNIQPVLWKKFMVNCAINPLTLIYQCQNGKLISNPEYHEHMQHICTEIDQVTQAMQYDLPNSITLAENVCSVTANNFSSMLQDNKHNRPTEIDYMTGFLVEKAATFGLSCPINKQLYQRIRLVK